MEKIEETMKKDKDKVRNVTKMIVEGQKGTQNNIKIIKHCGDVKFLLCSWLP